MYSVTLARLYKKSHEWMDKCVNADFEGKAKSGRRYSHVYHLQVRHFQTPTNIPTSRHEHLIVMDLPWNAD